MTTETSIPFFYRISETIRRRIDSDIYQAGELIPSEKELEKEFSVSSITIRKALDLLVRDGLVIRGRGVGTKVLKREKDRMSINITGNFRDWFDSASGNFPKLEIEVLDIGLTSCPERIRKILDVPKDFQIWRMERVRKHRGEVVSYYQNYGLPELFDQFNLKTFKKCSFFEVLRTRCGVEVGKIDQTIEATIADIELSSILDVKFGDPLFFGENIYYDKRHSPLEVTHMYYRGDRYTYEATIQLTENTAE
ncbi:GntR family transcriptional regulator [Thermodesulfobacteriota bacterium]